MPIPDVMHLLFERGQFCGAFEDRSAAERTLEARKKGGHGPHEIAEYRRVPATSRAQCQHDWEPTYDRGELKGN